MEPPNQSPLFKDLPPRKKVVPPLPGQSARDDDSPAVELIRQKIAQLYKDEPDGEREFAQAKAAGKNVSKYQRFMRDLGNSGKSLAEIQTTWHEYYQALPDKEKHEVWQEFYSQHARPSQVISPHPHSTAKPHHPAPEPAPKAIVHAAVRTPSHKRPTHHSSDLRTMSDIKNQLVGKAQNRSKLSRRSHAKSLLFGLSAGLISIIILLFSFFNERIIAPLITPSRTVSTTPIIADPNSTVVGPEPIIIIPKINVEVPVVYDEMSTVEASVQSALERGVVHYPTTPSPGQQGNGAIFGHSSNNILNKGKYKFAFVLLGRLEPGDIFIVHKDSKRYVYRVYSKKIVPPTDLSVLGPADKPATFTLITCDPPGTSINRLVVLGEQITPDPGANVASTAQPTTTAAAQTAVLPSDAPSLWHRLTSWATD
jgi:sortase A